jgi:hypothetical protein
MFAGWLVESIGARDFARFSIARALFLEIFGLSFSEFTSCCTKKVVV